MSFTKQKKKTKETAEKAESDVRETAEKAESDVRRTRGKSESDEGKISPVMKNEIEQAQWREETKYRDVKEISERNTREATEGLIRDVDISSETKPSKTEWRIKKESEK
jgi:hypothetical protein